VCEVWVGGRRRVSEGRHQIGEAACTAFVAARTKLLTEA
jgi:hypothetical protein